MTQKNPKFKKEVFERYVNNCISVGYTKELAEQWVLDNFNVMFNLSKNKRITDKDGYYVD